MSGSAVDAAPTGLRYGVAASEPLVDHVEHAPSSPLPAMRAAIL
jgi:hypothetical protein